MCITFCVQGNGQVLEDVHVGGVGNSAHTGRQTFTMDELYGLCAHIQNQGIHQLNIVSGSRLTRLQ